MEMYYLPTRHLATQSANRPAHHVAKSENCPGHQSDNLPAHHIATPSDNPPTHHIATQSSEFHVTCVTYNYNSWIITDQISTWQFQIAPVVKPRSLLGSFLFSMFFITVIYAALFV